MEKENLDAQNIREKVLEREKNTKNLMNRRLQSPAFRRLNPLKDYEMNYEEFEQSLQQVNSNLINKKECDYIYHVSFFF